MEREKYFDMLWDMYYNYFDLYEEEEVAGEEFDLYAYCEITNERYMGTRSLKIYQYNDYEHCLVRTGERFSRENIDDSFFASCIEELVEVQSGHHQSYLSYVQIVSTPLTEEEISLVENYSYAKSFWFGLRGWCDLRLIAVDLAEMKVYANEEAEEVMDNYKPKRLAEKLGYEIS